MAKLSKLDRAWILNRLLDEPEGAMAAEADPYIDGYFTQRVRAGERPDYGYPTNRLPETTIARMEIHTSFMASRKPK